MYFLQYFFDHRWQQQQQWDEFRQQNVAVVQYLTLTAIKQLNIMVKRKATVDCNELFDHCVDNINTVKNINTIVIPVCSGIEGVIWCIIGRSSSYRLDMPSKNSYVFFGIDAVFDEASDALDLDGINDDDNREFFQIWKYCSWNLEYSYVFLK